MSLNAVTALSEETRVRIRALVEQAEPRWRRHGVGRSNQELIGPPLPDAFAVVAHQLRLEAGVDIEAAPHSCTTLVDLVRVLPAHQLLRALAVFSAFLSSPRFNSAHIEGLTQRAFEQQLNTIVAAAGAPFQLAAAAWSPALPDQTEPIVQPQPTARSAHGPSPRASGPRAVVATALRLEYDAVRAHLSDVQDCVHPKTGAVYEVGKFAASDGRVWDVLIVETGKGNVASGNETERALSYFAPSVAFFVGVAGGRKDVSKGDVVVAGKVYGYESGKDTEKGFDPRPEMAESSYAISSRARAEARRPRWSGSALEQGQRVPLVFNGPIASGEKLVGSSLSAIAKILGESYGDALAVEMEGFGFLRSATAHVGVERLLVRGISDLIDDKNEQGDLQWQPIAARHASDFAFQVLAAFAHPREPLPETGSGDRQPPPAAAPPPTGTVADSAPDPFFRTTAVVESKGHDRVPRCAWQLELRPSAAVSATKSQMHEALVRSLVVDRGDSQRWPRLLRPGHAQAPMTGGGAVWRLPYKTYNNEAGEETLALKSDGCLVFQRDNLWDVDKLAMDVGMLAFDLVVHTMVGAKFLASLGLHAEFQLTVRLRTSQAVGDGTTANFSHGILPEQPDRIARLKHRDVVGVTRFARDPQEDAQAFAVACKDALDRVLNEFELEDGHWNRGPSFLSVSGESVAALVARCQYLAGRA